MSSHENSAGSRLPRYFSLLALALVMSAAQACANGRSLESFESETHAAFGCEPKCKDRDDTKAPRKFSNASFDSTTFAASDLLPFRGHGTPRVDAGVDSSTHDADGDGPEVDARAPLPVPDARVPEVEAGPQRSPGQILADTLSDAEIWGRHDWAGPPGIGLCWVEDATAKPWAVCEYYVKSPVLGTDGGNGWPKYNGGGTGCVYSVDTPEQQTNCYFPERAADFCTPHTLLNVANQIRDALLNGACGDDVGDPEDYRIVFGTDASAPP